MSKDDLVRLRHMMDAAKEAVELAAGKSRHDIANERTLNLSLVRLIEVIGEAANRVSSTCRAKYPGIPWLQIIGMRNRLIHGYNDIDFDILYQTISEDLPSLIVELEKIIPPEKRL
ncbi:MAG: hypothetical protein A2060_07690 [Planctomycetes bacterium GWA2_50_13]|nr:MAG: hypothetical protein A2060_07690 [Planctomycetes bacterium GWA2_50_13]OHB96413.1 MAG: hypothetical protein A3I59_03430 [Planctomycetes bacterium RIFCSPLOWO2_02_FULL_50_16]OHC04661.1 MAG: hypothetical protein A3G17_09290 [Planctomycetes bacterium RIFCSPLOWO2_12_FULL_50_35]